MIVFKNVIYNPKEKDLKTVEKEAQTGAADYWIFVSEEIMSETKRTAHFATFVASYNPNEKY